ncbi:MAG: hypothetical protein IPK16_12775 [Anaerolineales bacterium]|nr:hypothetical protein [Anaerolineales bacterium]
MTDRSTLIARKHEVRRRIESLRRELVRYENAADPRRNRRRIGQIERDLERLQAEEFDLRVQIDRSSNQA